ncbi:MAG: esterase-like activity of phytase family protein [Bauldia sp.]|nr:esterase-like activity of phytase family protein [Bauldia sp.]
MLKKYLLAAAALALGTSASFAQQEFAATLVEHAILPANTVIAPPESAPVSLTVSGKYTTADRARAAEIGSVPGRDGVRLTGLSLPFAGQPVQGFSGIKAAGDGTYWSLSDNGFGNKLNSVDAALMIHHLGFDWDAGTVDRMETIFLTDPDANVPFPIVHEGTAERFLTGADFDIESIQPVEDGFWLGEEFGPYLVKVDLEGRVQSVIGTMVGDLAVRSPDHPALALPANPTLGLPSFNLKRSGGFEGLAQSPDGSKLYGLLEGALFNADGTMEMVGETRGLRVIEFDIASEEWTGRSWLYPLSVDGDAAGDAIGDFNMIDGTHALVIERDQGVGDLAEACANPQQPAPDCFANPARFKRIYLIAFGDDNVGGAVEKIAYIDLLAIADPEGIALQGTTDGVYTMPFNTIENVDRVDATHIIVADDNNLPFSAGRALDRADDNEFVILEVGDFLAAANP